MSKEDIDKAVQEAEAYAAEDKKRREAVDIRNNADQMIYQTEKTVTEFGDKLSDDEKAKIEAAKEALKESLKGEDLDDIKAKQDALQKEIFAVSEKIYKAANPQGDAAAAGDANAADADPNVYEADYTDVDDNNK